MTTARSQQIDLAATPYYHVVSRCVRRSFLCGMDHVSKRNFDHRRGWLVERFRNLSHHFAIEIAGFSCMSNHYHLILRVDRKSALTWSDEEVVRRWGALCKGSEAFHATHDKPLSKTDLKLFALKIPVWRERLHDISWFMKMLNEYISRRANFEDKCKGRFWESRFKSQALLDSRAILSAMAYVDLNPIRAKMAESLIKSDYTSIQERMVHHAKKHSPKSAAAKKKLPYRAQRLPTLLPFFDQGVRKSKNNPNPQALPFSFTGYIELVDWTGRQLRKDKRGAIPAHAKSALSDLGIDHNEWVTTVQRIRHGFGSAVGDAISLGKWCEKRGQLWIKGMGLDKRRQPLQ